MRIHCDNPTCSSYLELIDVGSGASIDNLVSSLESLLAEMGWRYTNDSTRFVAVCPRCVRDLAYA